VKVALPLASVVPEPVLGALGPLSTLKLTVTPGAGLPAFTTCAVTVWLPPTGSVPAAGSNVMLEVTTMPDPLTMTYGDPQASAPVSTSLAQYDLGTVGSVARASGE
jgi:hypothetical protein